MKGVKADKIILKELAFLKSNWRRNPRFKNLDFHTLCISYFIDLIWGYSNKV